MKTLTTLLALAILSATASAQTIKSLGFNTTNGEVVANTGTNTLTFTNVLAFTTNAVPQVRTNLGLGATWLTNTNAETFRTDIGLYDTNLDNATVFSALALYDFANGDIGLEVFDGALRVISQLITTTAPADTTNAVRWIEVIEGTNSYRIPLFQ
jgi:hypothetical protein